MTMHNETDLPGNGPASIERDSGRPAPASNVPCESALETPAIGTLAPDHDVISVEDVVTLPEADDEVISGDGVVALPDSAPGHWCYARQGRAYGPVAEAEIEHLIKSGNLEAGDLVWRPGDAASRPLGQCPEFAALLPSPSSPARPPEKRLTLREHFAAIEDMVKRKCRSEAEYLLMAGGGGGAPMLGAAAFSGQPGMLHSDVFGNIRSGNSSFVIGQTGHHGQAGLLSSDVFGNIRAGGNSFVIGQTSQTQQAGLLHNDAFGSVFAGNSSFPVGQL